MEKSINLIECAGGIVKNKKKIVLIKMYAVEGWSFPKGRIEKGESPLEAAKREIYEETGLDQIDLIKELGVYSSPVADGKPILLKIHMFLFKTSQVITTPVKEDVKDSNYFPINQILDVLVLKEDKEFFKKVEEAL